VFFNWCKSLLCRLPE